MKKPILILLFLSVTILIKGQGDILQIRLGDENVPSKASEIIRITFDSVQMLRPMMGVQRWDMYSGEGATQKQELGYLEGAQAFLKPEQWWHRAPFFTRLTKDVDWVTHPDGAGPLWINYPYDFAFVQEAMDQEIDFATDAGIDFFIFNGPARTIHSNGWGLHNNLDAYLLNTRGDKVKFVCALYGHSAMNYGRTLVDLMLDEAISYMKLPEWQTVLTGRPLVPVIFPEGFRDQLEGQEDPAEKMTSAEFVQHIRDRVMAAGLRNPYIVATPVPARSYESADEYQADGYDAFTDYAGSYGGAMVTFGNGPSFASATVAMQLKWDNSFKTQTLDFVPPMSNGNYSWPRAEGDTWYIIEENLPGDMKALVKTSLQYVVDNPDDCDAQVLFSYSWNEHSEGGGICPTMGESPDYIPVTAKLDEFAEGFSEFEAANTPDPAKRIMQVNKIGRTVVEFPLSDLNDILYEGYGYAELYIHHDDTSTSRLMTDIEKIDFDGDGNMDIILRAGGDPIRFAIDNIDSMRFETPQTIPEPQELIIKGDFNYFDAININFSGEPNDFDWRGSHTGEEPNVSDWKSMNAGGGIQRAAFCKEHVPAQFLASNKITLEEGETFRLIFSHKQNSAAETTEGVGLYVFLSSTQDKANVTDTVRTITDFSMTEFVFDTTDFQVQNGADYYLVFSTIAPSDSADIKLYVDDVSLKQLLHLNTVYLETTIEAVQNAIDAQVENIGYGMGEYTQTLMDMATNAIAAAQDVLENATKQDQLDEALAALENDMTKFVANPTSTTILRSVIDSAQAVVDAQSDNIGVEIGQYAQASVDAAIAAITAAENVRDTAYKQSSVDYAVTALRSQMASFVANTTSPPDITALQNAINDALAKVDTATVGNGTGEYSQEVMDIAVNAITDAQNVRDTATLQSVVDAAVGTLIAEMEKFIPNITGVDHTESPAFSIYPNPVSDVLYINAGEPVRYKITDTSGRVLLNERTSGNRIDVSALQDGIYFLQIEVDNYTVRTMRFMKMQ